MPRTLTPSVDHENPATNYGAEIWRQPPIDSDDTIIFSECGRVMDNVCYRAYWFVLAKTRFNSYFLRVRHGGGEETIALGFSPRIVESMKGMSSDDRYFMLHTIYDAATDARRAAAISTQETWATAFLEKRIKTRRHNGRRRVEIVSFEQAESEQSA